MRTTITLNDKVYRALKVRAAERDSSVSALVEEAVAHQLLEDLEDIDDAKKRQHESTAPFDELVAELRSEGLI